MPKCPGGTIALKEPSQPPGKAQPSTKRKPVPETTGLRSRKTSMGADACPVPEGQEVGDLMTGEPATALVNGGRNYNGPKLRGEGEALPPWGSEPSVRYHSGRARILTLCQGPTGQCGGQSQVDSFYGAWWPPKGNGGVQRFPRPDGDWPSSAKAEGSLTARPTRRAGTKVGLSDPTVPEGPSLNG
ncbi:hypothetical protein H6P81_000015 [Aristolochia fimbriata]|uniref:Uncharacterized protein n=1 Tax=Aristolochia fimbriata TaxID=158543 RepID=A0AAV7F6U1_ARIFI|nr:hypothetical protein H6P81_000015 [Aristolochia fimbriata]